MYAAKLVQLQKLREVQMDQRMRQRLLVRPWSSKHFMVCTWEYVTVIEPQQRLHSSCRIRCQVFTLYPRSETCIFSLSILAWLIFICINVHDTSCKQAEDNCWPSRLETIQ